MTTMTAATAIMVSMVGSQVLGQMMAPDQPQGGGDGGAGPAVPDAVKTPAPMPVAPKPGGISKAKAERSLAQQMSMTRASTILSDDNSKLG